MRRRDRPHAATVVQVAPFDPAGEEADDEQVFGAGGSPGLTGYVISGIPSVSPSNVVPVRGVPRTKRGRSRATATLMAAWRSGLAM